MALKKEAKMTAAAITDLIICGVIIIGLFWVMNQERRNDD